MQCFNANGVNHASCFEIDQLTWCVDVNTKARLRCLHLWQPLIGIETGVGQQDAERLLERVNGQILTSGHRCISITSVGVARREIDQCHATARHDTLS